MFTQFDQVTQYMDSFTNQERKSDPKTRRTYRLDRMRALLEHFSNPEKSYRCIHVAGSKGKGSTASFIAAALKASGYKTGLYMSPHVVDYRERFSLAGTFFDDEILLKVANQLLQGLEGFYFCESLGENVPTTFELYTLYAFMLFKEASCQWAVIETGLGGRLDATNVITPEASVLTPIELEHTELLGKTIELIAIEKSKIIKPSVPVFCSRQLPEARKVFETEALNQHSTIRFLEDELIKQSVEIAPDAEKQLVKLKFSFSLEVEYRMRMLGKVQSDNSALALMVLWHLGLYKKDVTLKAIEENSLPGRMERVFYRRPIFFDGAHTPRSMESLINTFKAIYPGTSSVVIFCCVNGKDYESLVSDVLDAFDTVIVSRPGVFKKSDPSMIAQLLTNKALRDFPPDSKRIILEEDGDKALKLALSSCDEGQAVLVTGSFYMAGEIKEALCRLTGVK